MEQRLFWRAYSWGMVMQESAKAVCQYTPLVCVKNLWEGWYSIRVRFACVFLCQKSGVLYDKGTV